MMLLSELPLPAWALQWTSNRYMQLFPIAIMYFIPTLMLIGVAWIAIEESMFSRDKFPVRGKTVVITGGSQGMGKAAAKLLAKRGANVVIVARTKQKLEAAMEGIAAAAANPEKQKFHYISADLTNPTESTRILREVSVWNNNRPPDVVWAIAGYSIPQLYLDATTEQLRVMFEANYWTAAYLAQATLKAWLAPSAGFTNEIATFDDGRPRRTKPDARHFIMTSSSAAFVGVAGYALYAPAKAALRSLHDSLHSEVQLYNGGNKTKMIPDVKMHIIFPGTIQSPGHAEEQKTKHPLTKLLEKDDPVQTEEQAAEAAILGLERGNAIIATNWLGTLMRAGSLQISRRDRPVMDTMMSWVAGIVALFVVPDMDKKAFKYGQTYGTPQHKK